MVVLASAANWAPADEMDVGCWMSPHSTAIVHPSPFLFFLSFSPDLRPLSVAALRNKKLLVFFRARFRSGRRYQNPLSDGGRDGKKMCLVHTYMHTYILHTYIHRSTYLHTSRHTYIHTYSTYIHTTHAHLDISPTTPPPTGASPPLPVTCRPQRAFFPPLPTFLSDEFTVNIVPNLPNLQQISCLIYIEYRA